MPASVPLGNIYLEYEIEFSIPQLNATSAISDVFFIAPFTLIGSGSPSSIVLGSPFTSSPNADVSASGNVFTIIGLTDGREFTMNLSWAASDTTFEMSPAQLLWTPAVTGLNTGFNATGDYAHFGGSGADGTAVMTGVVTGLCTGAPITITIPSGTADESAEGGLGTLSIAVGPSPAAVARRHVPMRKRLEMLEKKFLTLSMSTAP